MYKKSPIKIIGIGIFILAAMIAFGFITMSLWNWLIPSLFKGPVITYWQAVGLLVLSRILLPGGHGPGKSHRHTHPRSEWKTHFKARMNSNSSETSTPIKVDPPASVQEESS